MQTVNRTVIALILAMAVLPTTIAGAETTPPDRVDTKEYMSATWPISAYVFGIVDLGPVVWFVEPGEERVRLTIDDDTAEQPVGFYSFFDAEDRQIDDGSFCRHATLDIPSGAEGIQLQVGIKPSLGCTIGEVSGISGTATAEFWR